MSRESGQIGGKLVREGVHFSVTPCKCCILKPGLSVLKIFQDLIELRMETFVCYLNIHLKTSYSLEEKMVKWIDFVKNRGFVELFPQSYEWFFLPFSPDELVFIESTPESWLWLTINSFWSNFPWLGRPLGDDVKGPEIENLFQKPK